MRRRLAGLVLLASLTACATAERDRETVLLRDARECEADADSQLQNAGQVDPGIRLLFFQACMSLRGWQGE
ncbi:MAG: hypothetical protein DMD75_10120 [Candidatus Rokuibacteriota bacterium]|jgi:hypothetical protein|nr:MAG: hypothetical protein DMD75_10120 [Candidatus Rokubacteria bacterium]